MCVSAQTVVVLAAPVFLLLVGPSLARASPSNVANSGDKAIHVHQNTRVTRREMKVTIGPDARDLMPSGPLLSVNATGPRLVSVPAGKGLLRRANASELANTTGRSFVALREEMVRADGDTEIGGTMLVLVRSQDAFLRDPFVTYSLKFVIAKDFDIEQDQVALGLDKYSTEVFETNGTKRGMVKVRYCTIYPGGEGRNATGQVEKMVHAPPELISNKIHSVLDYLHGNYTPEVTFVGAMNGCETDLQAGDVINSGPSTP